MKPGAQLHPPARQKGIRGASGLHPPTHPARGGGVSAATPRPAWVRPRRLAAGVAGRPPTGDRVHGADLEPEAEAGSGAERALSGLSPAPPGPGPQNLGPDAGRTQTGWKQLGPPGRGWVGTGQGRARQGAGLLPPQPSPGPAFVLRSRGAGLEAAIVCAPGLHPSWPAWPGQQGASAPGTSWLGPEPGQVLVMVVVVVVVVGGTRLGCKARPWWPPLFLSVCKSQADTGAGKPVSRVSPTQGPNLGPAWDLPKWSQNRCARELRGWGVPCPRAEEGRRSLWLEFPSFQAGIGG